MGEISSKNKNQRIFRACVVRQASPPRPHELVIVCTARSLQGAGTLCHQGQLCSSQAPQCPGLAQGLTLGSLLPLAAIGKVYGRVWCGRDICVPG